VVSRIVIGHCDAAHAGRVCGQNTFFRIFQNNAFLCADAKVMSCFKKNIRGGFDRGNIQTADNDVKEMPNVKTRQYAIDRVSVGR